MLGRELIQTILDQHLEDEEMEITNPEWGGGEPDAVQRFDIIRLEASEDDEGDTFGSIVVAEK